MGALVDVVDNRRVPSPAATDSLLSWLRVHAHTEETHIDLTYQRWLRPLHLCTIAAVAARCCSTNTTFRLTGPSDRSVANYAARMRLGRALEGLGAAHDLPSVRERDLRGELLELSELRSPDETRALAALVRDKVEPHDQAAAHALWESLAEIGGNVTDHSQSTGFAAAQSFRDGRIHFAVADAGVGLRATLTHRGARTDRDALQLALSGTSRHIGDPDRGTGIPTTLRHVSELDGSLYIASGGASVRATSAGRAHGELPSVFRGTVLEGVLAVRAR